MTTTSRAQGVTLAILIGIHVALLFHLASRMSPCLDETGHLAAGLYHWRFNRFDCYIVNPPLVRLVATLPIHVAGYEMDWAGFVDRRSLVRPEFYYAETFFHLNGAEALRYLKMARWSAIVFSVIGAFAVYRATDWIYGRQSATVAVSLWCFSPTILGNGALIAPDIAAASIGLWACYHFARWIDQPSLHRAAICGLTMGVAQLTKSTWVVLFVVWPAIWLVTLPWRRTNHSWRLGLFQLTTILFVALVVLNAGYGWEGTGTRLGDFDFVSEALTSSKSSNRFRGTLVDRLPMVMPQEYVHGIDYQKRDFESVWESYLNGTWSENGWWYYYLFAVLVKTPISTLVLFGVGIIVRVSYGRWSIGEFALLTPLVSVFAFVSSQTGINHHLRYVLPALPMMYLVSGFPVARQLRARTTGQYAIWILVVCSAASSLAVYPHNLAYFNALVGGARNGWRHLAFSNVDWGQGLYDLRDWQIAHPDARPLFVRHCVGTIDPAACGIDCHDTVGNGKLGAGWYAISAHELAKPSMVRFQRLQPDAIVAGCVFIFHLSGDEKNLD